MPAAVLAAKVASSEPSVANKIFVGKMLMLSSIYLCTNKPSVYALQPTLRDLDGLWEVVELPEKDAFCGATKGIRERTISVLGWRHSTMHRVIQARLLRNQA
jgi:hypothetical protein